MIAVTPLEHELYWSEDKHTPMEVRDAAQLKALQYFDKMAILNTNLVFGRDSYIVHYMTQCAAAGKIPKAIGGSKNFQYKPISSEDLSSAVEYALGNINDVNGHCFTVNGADSATLNDILHLAEQKVGKDQGNTGLRGRPLLGLSDYVEEFFTGITHDKNMARMAQYMEQHTPNLEQDDYHKRFNLSHSVKLKEYFEGKKVRVEELVTPIFTDYKMVSLN